MNDLHSRQKDNVCDCNGAGICEHGNDHKPLACSEVKFSLKTIEGVLQMAERGGLDKRTVSWIRKTLKDLEKASIEADELIEELGLKGLENVR
jgi:hypothetical protein